MTNEMTIMPRKQVATLEVMKQMAERPLTALAEYYGDVLGRRLDSRQTLHLVGAQLSFLLTVFVSMSLPLRVLCLAWFVGSVLKCRASMRGE